MTTHTSHEYFHVDPDLSVGTFGKVTDTANGTRVVFNTGDFKIVLIGDFTFDENGITGGTLNTMRLLDPGALLSEYTNINMDINGLISHTGIVDYATLTASFFAGDDVLTGNNVFNNFKSGDGNDTISGGTASDVLYGQAGDDVINGRGGRDYINGGNGDDQIFGGAKADILLGGRGNDILNGGSGDDVVVGGAGGRGFTAAAGNDTLTGGTGADQFAFISDGGGNHVITDFTDGEDILFLLNYGITSASEARSYASNVDGDTVFDFGGGHTITVENVDKSIFRVADFMFDDIVS